MNKRDNPDQGHYSQTGTTADETGPSNALELENINWMAWNVHRDLGQLAAEIESQAREEHENGEEDAEQALYDHKTLVGQAYAYTQRAREYLDALTDLTKDERPMTPEQWARLNRAR